MQDFIKLENEILKRWEREQTFQKLQQKLKGQKTFSFFDGPITANNKMGVHHAWGRTLKDTFQRYKAMRGFDQRWQNGFDCQGLWVEVEVEKDLGLNSKPEIEAYGLDKFSKKCRARVEKFASIITEQSKRLGQWMDWDNSYFTFDDNNIEHIWHFLKVCHQKDWLHQDERVMPWCRRCGTSLSQHEMSDSYKQLTHPAVTVKFKLKESGQHVLAWTTTPWTLPANTALAVDPNGQHKTLIGKDYIQPFTGDIFKVVAWEDVDDQEGTGIVHIAPGCGIDDHELGKKLGLEVKTVPESDLGKNEKVIKLLKEKGILANKEDYQHRYPVCWRCKEELVFKLDKEWFIKSDQIRPRMKQVASRVNWTLKGAGSRMQDWLDNMGDWNISRKRYWGLSLPFYLCKCGQLTVIGSVAELKKLATDQKKVESLPELHKPWIDQVKINCPKCKGEVTRIPEVGDCWLDAGIVPFSTLNYLSDKQYWKKWFPADLVSEMREQIRLWFYSMLFMSVTLTGRAPYRAVSSYEKVMSEHGKPMHKSDGTAIWFDEAVEQMGADVMRWLYLRQNPQFNVNFGYNLAKDMKQVLNTYWNSVVFSTEFAVDSRKKNSQIDQWITSRLNQTVKTVTTLLDDFRVYKAVRSLEAMIDDLSNWYIRRTRTNTNLTVLKTVLTKLTQLMAPLVPFITEESYQRLTSEGSVHLSDWPKAGEVNKELNQAMVRVRQLAGLALAQRAEAGLKVRQPLQSLTIKDTDLSEELLELLKDEVNVKAIKTGGKFKLDTALTPQLEQEGKDRDLIRQIQVARKNAGLAPEDKIILTYPDEVSDLVKKEVKARQVKKGGFSVVKM